MADASPKSIPQLRPKDTSGERRTTWAELLNDLVFTVIIYQLAQRLLDDVSGQSVAEFLLLYVPVWWLWNGETHYATRFDNERDTVHRFLGSMQLLGLIVLAATIPKALENNQSSVLYALTYSAVRVVLLIEYARAYYYVPEARPYIRHIGTGFAISVLIWVASAFVEQPYRFVLWGVALLIELSTPLTSAGGKLHQDFPPDVRHLPERYGLFTLIVLGQAVTSTAQGLISTGFETTTVLATLLGGIVIIGLWWAYFDRLDDDAVRQVAEGRSGRLYALWLYLHLPLTVALTVVGIGLTLVIRHVDDRVLPSLVQWLFIGGIGGYFAAETGISLTTLRAGPPHPSFVRGVVVRAGLTVSLAIIGLALSINALTLLGLAAAAIVGLIISDQFGPDAPPSEERITTANQPETNEPLPHESGSATVSG